MATLTDTTAPILDAQGNFLYGIIKLSPLSAVSPVFGNLINIEIGADGLPLSGVPAEMPAGDYCFDYIPNGSRRGGQCNWVVTVPANINTYTPQQVIALAEPAGTYRQSITDVRALLTTCEADLAAMADDIATVTALQAQIVQLQETIADQALQIELYEETFAPVTEAEIFTLMQSIRGQGSLGATARPEPDCGDRSVSVRGRTVNAIRSRTAPAPSIDRARQAAGCTRQTDLAAMMASASRTPLMPRTKAECDAEEESTGTTTVTATGTVTTPTCIPCGS